MRTRGGRADDVAVPGDGGGSVGSVTADEVDQYCADRGTEESDVEDVALAEARAGARALPSDRPVALTEAPRRHVAPRCPRLSPSSADVGRAVCRCAHLFTPVFVDEKRNERESGSVCIRVCRFFYCRFNGVTLPRRICG